MNDFKMKELAEAKCTLISAFKSQMNNIDTADTKELGEVADIIKDLAYAEKCCYESCYYKTVIDAMEEGSEPRYGYSRPYYNNYGNGRNNMMGYKPMIDQEPYINGYLNDPNFETKMNSGIGNMRYGYIRPETMNSAIDSVKDIWDNSDPEKKKRLKRELMAMIDEDN